MTCVCRRILFCLWLAASGAAESVVWVDRGRARLPICVGSAPSQTVRLAAEELAAYVGKMSRARVPIVAATPAGRPAVFVGAQAARERGLNLPLDALGPEGYVMQVRRGVGVALAGRTDDGTLNAAYDLLHLLGVRWFFPGPAGEHAPQLAAVRVPTMNRRFEPTFLYRNIWAASGRLPRELGAQYNDWRRRQHMPGALKGSMGHAYAHFIPRKLFKEKPDLFAEVNGRRTPRGQICTTHPEVIQRAIDYARRYFRQHPECLMVSMSPNDGGGFCRCARCRAEGSPSDNALLLANRVADAIAREFPGHYVSFYAYSGTAPPPHHDARPNVIVWIATRFIPKGYTLDQLVRGWSKHVHHIGIRDYYSVAAWSWEAPRYDPEALAEQLRYYRDNKAVGVSAESEDNFGSRGPRYYVAARLMYDMNQSLNDVLDDYYANCWGAAAPAMRRYWERWRGARIVSRDRLALALRDLREASALAGADEVRARLACMKAYLHYLRLFREYGQAPRKDKERRIQALGRAMSYGFAIQPLHMVMIPNVYYRIVGKPKHRRLDVPETTLRAWRQTRPIDMEQIEADFQRDLAEVKPLGVERRAFDEQLVRLSIRRSGRAARPAFRGRNTCVVQAAKAGPLRLGVTTGLVRRYGVALTLETLDGRQVSRVELPAGLAQRVAVDTGRDAPDTLALKGQASPTALRAPRPGLYQLRIEPEGGSACRIDFGSIPHAMRAAQDAAFSFIAGSAGPLYFFVPRDVRAFGVGLRTPDHYGELTVRDARGRVRLLRRGDYTLGEEFRVDVPPDEDAAIWSLEIRRCEDSSLYLFGAPGWVSLRPDAILVPRDAAQ